VVLPFVIAGPDWPKALASLPWKDGEVLVSGSSVRAPSIRALLGADATRIVRSAPVPVVVVPRDSAMSTNRPEAAAAGSSALS
jgi:hypothetical protein